MSNKPLIIVVLLYTYIAVFRNCSAAPDIDQEHLLKVPDCGKIQSTWNNPIYWHESVSSRISNAQEAEMHYPWVIRVNRIFYGKEVESCGGTLLSKRLREFQTLQGYIISDKG